MTARPVTLCRLEQIPDGGAGVFSCAQSTVSVIVVRKQNQVWGYRNQCPHFSIRLDYQPGTIHTYRSEVLMCAHHSALFRFEDGVCIEGPCAGAALDAVPLHIDSSGEVLLAAGQQQAEQLS